MRAPRLACMLLAVGCGETEAPLGGGDGGLPDGGAVGSITVTVGQLFGASQPIAGNRVVVVDRSGEVAADIVTDAGGVAAADDIEAGSTLVILIAEPPAGARPDRQAMVIVGLEPGDDIHIDPEESEGAAIGAMNVVWQPFAGASNYQVDTGCSTATTNDTIATLDFFLGCAPGGEIAALVRAVDAADGTLAWLGGLSLLDPDQPFDLGDSWGAPRNLRVTLSDIPPEARQVQIGLRPSRAGVLFQPIDLPAVPLGSETAEVLLHLPRAFVDSDLVSLDFQPNQPGFGQNGLAVRIEPDTTSLPIEVAGELLPWYGSPLLDSEARTLHWTRSAGREPDAQFLLVSWTDQDASSGLTYVMVPPDVSSVTVPELPAEFERFLPVNPASLAIQLYAGESTELDDYRAARQTGFSLLHAPPAIGFAPPGSVTRSSMSGVPGDS